MPAQAPRSPRQLRRLVPGADEEPAPVHQNDLDPVHDACWLACITSSLLSEDLRTPRQATHCLASDALSLMTKATVVAKADFASG